MKVGLPFFDRAQWESCHATLADPRAAATERSRALQQVRVNASNTLERLRTAPLPARHDIKLMDRVLQQAVRQDGATQPACRRLIRAVWRWLRLPDALARQQRQAHALAQGSSKRWCAEDDRFLQLATLLLEEQELKAGEDKLTLLPEDRAFFDRYLRKMPKRLPLLRAYKALETDASDVVVQLLRIQRGMGKKFAPKRLAELLEKATTLRAGGEAARRCAPFSVEDFGLFSLLGEALERLLKLNQVGMLPKAYATTLRLLQELQDFSRQASAEIAADRQCRPGDIEFDDFGLAFRSHNALMGWMEHGFMAATCSGFVHASVSLLDSRRAEMAAMGFRRRRPELDEMIASNAHRIDWHRLVTASGKKSLEAEWGPTWPTRLQQVFENRVTRLVNRPELKRVAFSQDYMRVPLRLHWQRKPEPLDALPTDRMFCSEFAARTLAVTLHGLDADLRANSKDPRPRVLHRIFSHHENYTAVSPGHLARRLRPWTLKVPQPPALKKYIGHQAPGHHFVEILKFAATKAGVLRARKA